MIASKEFWNTLLEKAFLALIAWFMLSLIKDVRTLNESIQSLNQKMAVVITEVANQKENIKRLETDVDWLSKNKVDKRQ